MDFTVYLNAARPVLIALVSRLVLAAGTVLVAHGYLTEDQVHQGVDPVTQQLVGWIIAGAAMLFGAWWSKHRNDVSIAALFASPVSLPADKALPSVASKSVEVK